ncbi:major facilitator superfamily domain-containing protein [Annulohypoxylon nitens]|nr:major facilitator superfamily domain-containing protein [Annulohypoxylon nitens]
MGQTNDQTATVFVPPDGGRRAWLALAGGWLCHFCSFGFVSALGTFQMVYETEILPEKTTSEISWILTMQLFLMFFLSQPVGLGIDMFGPRGILIPSLVFSVGGLIALSYATEYYQVFLAQSLCFGLGAAGAFVCGLVVAGQYFEKKRALAIGIVSTGGSSGGVVFPIMLARLFDEIGFGPTLRWTSLFIGVLLAIACALVSPAFPAKGFAGRGSFISFAVFRKPEYVIFAAGSFLFFWGLFGPFNYLPLFAGADASTAGVSFYTLSIISAASIPGRVLPTMISDRVGTMKTTTATCLLTGIAILVIWLPINYHKSLAGLVIFAIFFGFISSAFISLTVVALYEITGGGTSDMGANLGTYLAIVAISSLTGLPIQGAIAKNPDGTDLAGLIIFCGVVILAGGLLLVWGTVLTTKRLKRTRTKNRG